MIPTPRKKVPGGVEMRAPDATSTPKAMAKAASGSKSKGQAEQSRSALAKDAVPADTLPATTTPAAATPATTTAFATAVVPKASKVAAPAEPSERPSTSKEDAAPEAAHGSDLPASTEKPLSSTSIPEAAPKAALQKGSTADAARKGAKRPAKGGAESQRPRASKSGLKGDTAPSGCSKPAAVPTVPAMTKDARLTGTSKGEAKDTAPSGGSPTMTKDVRLPGTSKGEAKSRRPSASKSDTKGGTAPKAAGSTTALVAMSEPPPQVIGDACPTVPPPATPALAAPAIHVDDQQLQTNEEGTPTFRPVPRRLHPSTSLGGLDSVRPYEGLPRRTTLPVDPHAPLQVGGHGRVPDHPRGELSSNQEEAHKARRQDRVGYPYGINDSRHEAEPQDYGRYDYHREYEYRRGYYPHPARSIAGSHTGSLGERSVDGREHHHGPSYERRNYIDYPRGREPSDYPSYSRDHSHDEAVGYERANEHADEPHHRPYPPPNRERSHEPADGPRRRPYPSRSREHSREPHDGPLGHAFELHESEPNRGFRGAFGRDYPLDDYQRMREFYPQDRRHNRDHYDRPLGGRYPSDYDFDPRDAGFHDPSYYYRDGYGDVYRDRRRPEGYHARPQSPSRARSPGVTAVPEGSRARSPNVAPAGAPPETEATEP